VIKECLILESYHKLYHTFFFYSTGYDVKIMVRPDLHNYLYSKVPNNKIHLGKRILSIYTYPDYGVAIHTSDGESYEGDIPVGADGAYSGVRRQCISNWQSLASFLNRTPRALGPVV
jgi:2-polyprenyl-6-methoxyphenol hydroxylase-like FAD-dependent oxidoreductase